MRRILIISFLIFFSLINVYPQKKNFSYNLESTGGFISPNHVPFWFRSNRFGSIPLDNASLSLTGVIRKDYDTAKPRILDWGVSVEVRTNIGQKSNFTIIEGYAKLATGSWQKAVGSWQRVVSSWQKAVGSWQMQLAKSSCQ
jgi:hypothetical protein